MLPPKDYLYAEENIVFVIENSRSCAGRGLYNTMLSFCSREFTTLKGTTAILPRLAVALAALLAFAFLSCSKSSGPERREVVLYCSVDQEIAEPIIAEFERQSGIKVLARFDTEASKTVGLVQKIKAEAASPVADVFWSSEIFHTIRLAVDSLLDSYSSDATADWPALYADGDGRWYGFALRARVIAYSTDRVSATEAPKSLEDVLAARWKGRLVMAAPEFGTTGGDVASWFAHYGDARARQILAALKANDIRIVAGNSTAVRMVATGQADVCFTDTDDVYAAQRNGWPVAMNFLDQGGDGVLTIPNTAAIIRGANHPKEASELMDFLLSEQLELMLVRSDSHNSPVHKTVAEQFSQYSIAKPLDVYHAKVADRLSVAIQTAREILR
ncbi:MAG: extracellular solute-binding protein [Planctomycetota bacterium]|jgi:iron(III) transport system substrate-binding protein